MELRENPGKHDAVSSSVDSLKKNGLLSNLQEAEGQLQLTLSSYLDPSPKTHRCSTTLPEVHFRQNGRQKPTTTTATNNTSKAVVACITCVRDG